ncbi:MAG: protein O-GlcNAc transferase [Aliidongia sp.]|nr:protein O-GlcNAc transferase [Aliidongia sp.]
MFRTDVSIDGLVQQGVAHHQAGRVDQAEALYRQVLARQPAFPDALHLLGLAALQRGRVAEAIATIGQAIRLNKDQPRYHLDLGHAEAARGQVEAARACWRRAHRLAARSAELLLAIGGAQAGAGCLEDAAASFRHAMRLNPRLVAAHHNLGSALACLGRYDEAATSYRAALALDPRYAEAETNLAAALAALGRLDEAVAGYQRSAALDPQAAAAQRGLGDALSALGRLDEAVAAYRAALTLQPGSAETFSNLGTALGNLGRREESEDAYEAALKLKPALLAARANLAVGRLPLLYRTEDEIDRARAAYGADLENLAATPLPTSLDAEAAGGVPPFYLAYQGRSDRDLQTLYGAHVTRIMTALYPRWAIAPKIDRPRPGQKIRVGVLSAYFYRHSNWKIPIKGWLGGLDPDRFEFYGYHLGSRQDAETALAADLCRRFVAGPRSLAGWAETIRADRLHVLLIPGIGMDPLTTRLAALKLAPVQATSWGHPETSGLPAIDHFLSSDLMEPVDAQSHYTEKLVRLPNLSIAYEPATIVPDPVTRAELDVSDGDTLYWCCQSLYKYLPRHDGVFAQIAVRHSAARFLFIAYPGDPAVTAIFQARLDAAFAATGLDARIFCRVLPHMAAGRFVGVTAASDIFLDSIGWSGCNSALEALDQGVPIVTLAGALMRGRHSAAILTMLGLPELIAATLEDYVTLAADLGRDPERRRALSARIAQDRHRLYRDPACLAGLARYLEDAVLGRL